LGLLLLLWLLLLLLELLPRFTAAAVLLPSSKQAGKESARTALELAGGGCRLLRSG